MSTARITLPGTGLSVSRLCLGGNRLGGELDRDRSFALLDAFVLAGGNFIDTAHVYADWLPKVERSCSEKTIGRWLTARTATDDVVVATKIGHPPLGSTGASRLDRASLRHDVEEARQNLGRGTLDLVYLHRDDPAVPAAEILAVLEEMRGEGTIRHYAASNWRAARLAEASEAARTHGFQGFVANQAEWSLARRNPGSAANDLFAMDDAMIGWHRRSGAAAIPYSAQARGYFDKIGTGALDDATRNAYGGAVNEARARRLSAFAARHGLSPTQAMLAVMRLAPFPVIPVVGCRDAGQVVSSFKGIDADVPRQDAAPFLDDLGLSAYEES